LSLLDRNPTVEPKSLAHFHILLYSRGKEAALLKIENEIKTRKAGVKL
jgi:hypothetical protein